MNTIETEPFFTQEQKTRILDHMNEDHSDAVLNYSLHFAGKLDVKSATLIGIDQEGIDIEAETEAGREPLRIEFSKPLEKPDDAHLTLVAMAKEARKGSALSRAKKTVNAFRSEFKTIILGTAAYNNVPDASVAPAVLGPDGAFYVFVSELSTHTQNIIDGGKASALIIQDEAESKQLLARKRLTFACEATEIVEGNMIYEARMEDLKTKFGPIMANLSQMEDFHMFCLQPISGRLINGFGQAFDVNPNDWNDLSQLGGSGQGHRRKKEAKDETNQ